MNKQIEMTLRDVMRSGEVTRWHIVKTLRHQSVAEHSFLVAMIAMRLCDVLEVDEKTKHDVLAYALMHDLPEVYMGDLPTPIKRMMGDDLCDKIEDFEGRITFSGMSCNTPHDSTVGLIVKIADMLEAVAFLETNGHGTHAFAVQCQIREAATAYGGKHAVGLIYELTQGLIQTLDDFKHEA